MPFSPELRFEVADDPLARLGNLKRTMRGRIARKAVRAGLAHIRKAAKAGAPKGATGALAASISSKIGTNKKTGATYGVVGPRRRFVRKVKGTVASFGQPSKIAHLVEFGVRPHSLAKGDTLARVRTNRKGEKTNVPGRQAGGGGQHPGAQANPFLERAIQATGHYAQNEMRQVIEDEVAKLLAKSKGK